MGREKGGSGRSKPSSSSLAAAHPGAVPFGFGGYVDGSLMGTTLLSKWEVSQDLDGEAAFQLKRLSKRDPTTKLKALAALRGTFKEQSVNGLAAILLAWVFEYIRLVQDNNRQVRENTHDVMADLTTNAGKGLARHLRSLMGAWWVSQFDPSREVAEAAQRSFQVTFPDRKKRVDVLVYCLEDIMAYLVENLKLTPQALTNMGTLPEEVAEKLERILSSSLLALAALLDVLVGSTSSLLKEGPAESTSATSAAVGAGEAVKKAATSLFYTHKSFESSVKNKSSQVRSAAYQTLRTYVQHIPQVFTDEENLDNSAKFVLGALGEKVTSCHQPMWDLILLFSRKMPQAWGSNSIRKAVLPKLWDFLRQGCFGSQQISYPCIYPLLAFIPPQFVAPPQGFFLEFFKSLWQGVYLPALSTADRRPLFKTFQECFVGIVKKAKRYAKDTDCKILQDFLVEEVLLKIVWCQYVNVASQTLLENSSQDQDSTSAVAASAHLQPVLPSPVWDDVAGTIVDILILLGQEEGVLDAFWPGFQTVSVGIFLDTSSENASRLTRLGDFFSVLHVKIPEIERMNNMWLLLNVVQPFVAKSIPAIRHSGHPEALRLLGKLIATYGQPAFASREQILGDSIRIQFLQEVVPCCLSGEEIRLIEPKIDLLLSFFEVKEFHCYWRSTIECATTAWLLPNGERIDLDDKDLVHVGVLATLVEKFSERWARVTMRTRNAANDDTDTNLLELWRLPRLDAAALAVANRNNLVQPACVRLLRSFLSPQTQEESLISSVATMQLMGMLSNHLIEVLLLHDTPWTRAAPSFIFFDKVDYTLPKAQNDDVEKSIRFELARSVLEVVVSMPTLGAFELEPTGSQLLSTIFCLYWAFLKPSSRTTDDGDSDESEDERWEEDSFPNIDGGEESSSTQEVSSTHHHIDRSRFSFLNCLENLRRSSSPVIYQKLRTENRECIRRILTEVVRSALVLEESPDIISTSTLCAGWVCDIVGYFCLGENEIQDIISCALAPSLSWPTWVADAEYIDNTIPIINFPRKAELVKEPVYQRFCAYADILATNLGPERVYTGRTSMSLDTGNGDYRIWLVIELLCSWESPDGSASLHLLEFLCDIARNATGKKFPSLLDMCFRSLFAGSSSKSLDPTAQDGPVDLSLEMGPSTKALLTLLRALLDGEAAWKREDVEQFFFEYNVKSSNAGDLADAGFLKFLPSVLLILMPVLRNPSLETSDAGSPAKEGWALKQTVCDWLNKALSFVPLSDFEEERVKVEGKHWLEVATACFPLQLPGVKSGIAAASSANVSLQETSLLLKLLRKQLTIAQASEPQLVSTDATDAMVQLESELTLAKVVAVSVAYCWQDFDVEGWAFILKCLRKWVDWAVVEHEEMTEIVVRFYKDGQQGNLDLPQPSGRKILIELTAVAVSILILLKDLCNLETVTALRARGTLRVSNWEAVEDHMMEALLRILLATGLSEAAALDFNADTEAANIISRHRMAESSLWENLAVVALGATNRSREAAVRAADLWGVGKGSISALYALLLSPNSSGALQRVAFQFLSTEPIQPLAVTCGSVSQTQGDDVDEGAPLDEASFVAGAQLRPELAKLLKTPEKLLLQSSSTSALRVRYLLGWSLLLMRLHTLPPLSPTRERLLQFAKVFDTSSTLLDCLFKLIPLDLTSGTPAFRRRKVAAGATISVAGTSATRAVSRKTVSLAVENLWPMKEENVVAFAGAVYGLLLQVLPACVRIWFTGLRDRSIASAIENFTSSNCSTHLLADEFSQLQASVVADETLSIRANRTLREVTAVYKKEEDCLEIVIRLPSCYPLRTVEVDCTKRLGMSETRIRKWILSMASFLQNQNGALLEAIQMWKKNADREFEGVEECPICYSIIHTTNHSFPRLACKTCKHKFHSACLYKWFSTSHKSTCPLCQSLF